MAIHSSLHIIGWSKVKTMRSPTSTSSFPEGLTEMMLGCCIVDSTSNVDAMSPLPSPRTQVTIASKNNNLYTIRRTLIRMARTSDLIVHKQAIVNTIVKRKGTRKVVVDYQRNSYKTCYSSPSFSSEMILVSSVLSTCEGCEKANTSQSGRDKRLGIHARFQIRSSHLRFRLTWKLLVWSICSHWHSPRHVNSLRHGLHWLHTLCHWLYTLSHWLHTCSRHTMH